VERGGKLAVLERQSGLDESGDARGGIQVTDIALHGSQGTELHVGGARPERLRQPRHLDGIAHGSRGAMALYIRYRAGVHASGGQSHFDDGCLAVDAGGGKPNFRGAVIVDAAAADYGINLIAVAQRVFQTFENHDSGAAAENRAGGVRIKRPAGTVGGHHAAFQMLIAAFLRKRDRYAPGQRHIRLIEQQALAGLRHRQQGSRARRLHREAGPLEIEFVGHARGQKIMAEAQQHGIATYLVVAGKFLDRAAITA
jgi:hypothetical protein